jgi:hypothetical protein
MDRDLTEKERKLRVDLLNLYNEGVVPQMGASYGGQLMFNQEGKIRAWFDDNPDATADQVTAFRDQLMAPIREIVGAQMVQEMFDDFK